MDDFDFEHLVADLWRKQGWNAEVEQQSSDAGVDVRATMLQPYERKALIQAKRYSDRNPVSGPDIQQYSALKQQEPDVDEAIIITTGYFTGSAEDRANDLNVKTIDGDALVSLIDNLGAYSLVEDYIGLPGGGSRASGTERSSTTSNQIDFEVRNILETVIDQGIDQFLKDEQYRATRTMERAKGKTKLNPYDAKVIGVFEEVPEENFERDFSRNKANLVAHKRDVHIDDEGTIYIEDLTEYIPHAAIQGEEEGPIIGVLERGIQDRVWMSEQGESILRKQKAKEEVKGRVQDGLNLIRNRRREHDTGSKENRDKKEIIETNSSDTDKVTESATQDSFDMIKSKWEQYDIGSRESRDEKETTKIDNSGTNETATLMSKDPTGDNSEFVGGKTANSSGLPGYTKSIPENDNYHYGAGAAVGLAILASSAGVSSLLLPSMVAASVLVYFDSIHVRRTGGWQPKGWLYALGTFLVFFVALPMYYYRRHKRIGL
jgi:hypothetical protein